jgi:hypothetical protein
MAHFTFVRRRSVWVPTFLGWLMLVALVSVIGFVLGRYFIYPFLAPNDPAPEARLLVVEGWLSPGELNQAIARFQQGSYDRVVTTGGPILEWRESNETQSYAESAARYLVRNGLDVAKVTPVPAPASAQDRTFLSAVKVREWAAHQGIEIKALDLFSSGTHARRSRMLYRMALGSGVSIGIVSATPDDYGPEYWWRTSSGVKSVVGETLGLAWTACCFFPAAQGSHEESWGVSAPATPHQ